MNARYVLGGAVAALVVGVGGFELAVPEPGASFINPIDLAGNACGKDPASAQKRRLYFQRVGAAYAATLNEQTAPSQRRGRPVAGIGYKVTTSSDAAQALFDAGLAHMWNFNHSEAIRLFKTAQTEDPNCAMCFWAEAFAWGPNINMPMPEEAAAPAYAAARKARALASKASAKEQALIDAIVARYAQTPPKDRAPLDGAFAAEMAKVAAAFPDDDFILSTAAEANMDAQPWDYWFADGRTPKGRTGETLALLETVLARNPDFQPAIHLYIHTTEATANPFRAVPYADRLAALSPGLGHLIHMPSHTYARIGRYKESMAANAAAVQADETFLASGEASPMFEFGYYVHNVHFLMTSAQMSGDGATALAMAEKLEAKIPTEMASKVPLAAPIKAAPYFAMAQFAEPQEILSLASPGDDAPFLKAAWHYARGEAFARQGNAEAARAEAAAIRKLRETSDFSTLVANLIPAPSVLKIEELTVSARAAAAEGDFADAIAAMEEVVALQEGLNYTEPPYWYYSAKQTLAAMVLKAGDPERAEQLFIESLAEIPNNGWALFGLAQAYRAQGEVSARKYAEKLFKSAWTGKEKPALDRL